MSSERPRGILMIVSSPSGAGKTTLCNKLRAEFPQIGFSVSYTTRPPRAGETDGVEYNFVGADRFQEMIAADEFAEYAMVHGNMYGTSAAQVGAALDEGKDLLFDIDFQGGRQLRSRFPDSVVLVFILPPSLSELERRLRSRATDADEVISQRLKVARSELAHFHEYDYLIRERGARGRLRRAAGGLCVGAPSPTAPGGPRSRADRGSGGAALVSRSADARPVAPEEGPFDEDETLDPAVDVRVGPGELMPKPDPLVAQGHAEVLLVREYEHLLEEVRKRLGEDAVGSVADAFELAESCHAGQMRKSGDPYLVHPLRVARILAGLGLDVASVIAGILHDTVEDSELTVVELTERFGREVALLVDGVTKLGKVPYLSRRENQAVSFRKLLVAMSRDIRVLLVKLVDRLDNMRTLDAMPANKQRRIARETADIYAPLARLLGVDWLRRELADLAFRYLEPVAAKTIRSEMVGLLTEDPTHIDRGIEMLREAFAGLGVQEAAEDTGLPSWNEDKFRAVQFRANVLTAQEVHELRNRGRVIEKLRDMVTYQVLTADRESSYLALGHLHAHFKPIPGSIRDYIALPRANGYQGLHTQVLDRMGVRLYVEIRSQAMNEVAERGVVVDLQKGLQTSELGWLHEMMGWQEQIEDPNEFIEAVKRRALCRSRSTPVHAGRATCKTFRQGRDSDRLRLRHPHRRGAARVQARGSMDTGGASALPHASGRHRRDPDGPHAPTARVEWLKMVRTRRGRGREDQTLLAHARAGSRWRIETGKQMLQPGTRDADALESLEGLDDRGRVTGGLFDRLSLES